MFGLKNQLIQSTIKPMTEMRLLPKPKSGIPETIPVPVIAYRCSDYHRAVPLELKDKQLGWHELNGATCPGTGTLPEEYVAGTMSLPISLFTPLDR
jgi:hypothetical protein